MRNQLPVMCYMPTRIDFARAIGTFFPRQHMVHRWEQEKEKRRQLVGPWREGILENALYNLPLQEVERDHALPLLKPSYQPQLCELMEAHQTGRGKFLGRRPLVEPTVINQGTRQY